MTKTLPVSETGESVEETRSEGSGGAVEQCADYCEGGRESSCNVLVAGLSQYDSSVWPAVSQRALTPLYINPLTSIQ